MHTQAIKMEQGCFIKDLPGFEEIKSDIINIDAEVTDSEFKKLGYKELRGTDIMEKYFEKRQREIYETVNVTNLQTEFRKKYSISPDSFSALIKEL